METLNKLRGSVRTLFTKGVNKLKNELAKEQVEEEEILTLFRRLQSLRDKLMDLDQKIEDELISKEDTTQEDFDEETEGVQSYGDQFLDLEASINSKVKSSPQELQARSVAGSTASAGSSGRKRYNLPKLEWVKFSGDPKEWLGFWSQFSAVHEDEDLADQDKFQYLLQATVAKSKARLVVESFPPTAENYPKAIEYLCERYGKKDVLVELYTRELLSLVLQKGKERGSITVLYDQLATQLRALESLGVKSESTMAVLYPRVESALPEDILKVWERKRVGEVLEQKERLKSLMEFLRAEVESEARVAMVKGSTIGRAATCGPRQKFYGDDAYVPTATELFNGQAHVKSNCVFCGKNNHKSSVCFEGKKLSLEEKGKKVREQKACLSCLKIGHFRRECKSRPNCQACGRDHYLLMCSEAEKMRKGHQSGKPPGSNVQGASGTGHVAALSNYSASGVLLQTLEVLVKGEFEVRRVRALLDTGSQHSYISKRASEELKLRRVGETRLVHSLFGGQTSKETHHQLFDLTVCPMNGSFSTQIRVMDQSQLCGVVPVVPHGPWLNELYLQGIQLSDTGTEFRDIHLLLGADVLGGLFTGNLYHLSMGPVAMQTQLGWTLMGKFREVVDIGQAAATVNTLHAGVINIQDLWKLDLLGITDPSTTQSRAEIEKSAMEHFRMTSRRDTEGRYVVSLPWLEGHPPVSDNLEAARKRLHSTYRKLEEKQMVSKYQTIFDEWRDFGIIERVEGFATTVGSFLPHRPVFKENSTTTPIRPVFDASTKSGGLPSLNDCLEAGPNLIERLLDILLRFRDGRYGVISDVKKAFLMIGVHEKDRNYLKFLWLENGKECVYRHCRVVFGVKSSPFLLAATLNALLDETAEEDKEIAEVLRRSLYVDNAVVSLDSEEKVKEFISTSKRLLDGAKMELRGWATTQTHQTGAPAAKNEVLPVLGLLWDTQQDSLSLDLRSVVVGIEEGCVPEVSADSPGVGPLTSRGCGLGEGRVKSVLTKRRILAVAHQIFDPLGLCCPVTLVPKLILRDLWKAGLGWDVEVPPEVAKRFQLWSKEIHHLQNWTFPRWTSAKVGGLKSLHTFTDASCQAYSACVFLRQEMENGNVSVQLLAAKSRVAPTKVVTIPRLELLGCCIGARLAATVKQALNIPHMDSYYWTDSTNVLFWIKKNENWSTFVWNRVQEIRKLTNPDAWRHVPGESNPADLPSRGCNAHQLLLTKWWEGPSWLKTGVDGWPKSEFAVDNETVMAEKKKVVVSQVAVVAERRWYLRFFSKYRRVVRMTAWILRWKNNRRGQDLSFEEEDIAERTLFKAVQNEMFGEASLVLKELRAKKFDDGLWRIETKIIFREDMENFRYPILLPHNHPLTRMMIAEEHRRRSHCGVQVLQCVLRENFWIPKSRKVIQEVIRKCGKCRRFIAKPFEAVEAPLPVDRVRDATVFEATGIDLGGPLYLRDGSKVWFILYTCAVYRAIHLELTNTLSTDGFLLSLRRFVARRGRPATIYTDNGKNFEGASNLLKRLDWKRIENETKVQKINWRFNPPSAPWWGGFWESLVKLVKTLLRRNLGKAALTWEELSTIICEAEGVINSRPLTYISECPDDLAALTPIMFLGEVKNIGVPDLDAVDANSLNKRLKYRQRLRENLRSRFRQEYLALLVHRKTIKRTTEVRVGDVVLLYDDQQKRVNWKLARVLELFIGKDGVERAARIQTASGELTRPIQRLLPFEVHGSEAEPIILKAKSDPIIKKTRSGREVKPPQWYVSDPW